MAATVVMIRVGSSPICLKQQMQKVSGFAGSSNIEDVRTFGIVEPSKAGVASWEGGFGFRVECHASNARSRLTSRR